jgi:hypothetical protein
MPEEEFLRRFTKTDAWTDPNKPYIISRSSNRYVVSEVPAYGNFKGRVTFVEGKLAKYEQFGRGENPFGYADCTFLLRR